MTNEKYTEEFQKALNNYIKLGFNQDECNGFMHGFHKGVEAQQLIIADVVNCLSCGKNHAELCGSCVSDIAQATGEQAQQSR